ncbi:MAG: hypothetical protein M3464_01060 [Chloroflexota bacterium]|nr:hypothetical protein [Chloroflexota bacterium]
MNAELFEREQAAGVESLGKERFRALVRDLETISEGAAIGDFTGWPR